MLKESHFWAKHISQKVLWLAHMQCLCVCVTCTHSCMFQDRTQWECKCKAINLQANTPKGWTVMLGLLQNPWKNSRKGKEKIIWLKSAEFGFFDWKMSGKCALCIEIVGTSRTRWRVYAEVKVRNAPREELTSLTRDVYQSHTQYVLLSRRAAETFRVQHRSRVRIKRTDVSKRPIRGALRPDPDLLRNSHSSTPQVSPSLSLYSSNMCTHKHTQTHSHRADSVCVSWHELTNQYEQCWRGWKGLIVGLNALIILMSRDEGA